eukprot:6187133-Pleurochrysis_carterae.AAC.2
MNFPACISTCAVPNSIPPQVIAFFSFFIIFFQRSVEIPTANELSEVKDTGRLAAAVVAATFMLFTLLPYPAVEQTTQMLI